jgi:hypothetical protein
MAKREASRCEGELPDTMMLSDIVNQAKPEVYWPLVKKILRLYCKVYNSTPDVPDKILLHLSLLEYFATDVILKESGERLVWCINNMLGQYVGKQLANTDLVDVVSRH